MSQADAFLMLATNAFNYEMLGEAAYNAVRHLVTTATCYRLVYSDLARAVPLLTDIAENDASAG
jgi:hypothetical protein